jgi:biopolymer transport protein ExbB
MKKSWTKLVLFLGMVLSAWSLSAKSFIDVYNEGGIFMHFISGMLVIMLVIAITKYWQLSIKEKLDTKKFYLKLKGYIKNEQFDQAIKVSEQFKHTTMGFIFWNGLLSFRDARDAGKTGQDLESAINNAFDEAGLQTIPKIESGLFWLDIIAQTATLLGLLGTIAGLIESFDALATAAEAEKSTLLTQGIAQAMGTTFYGLIVAIPTYFIKGALQARAKKIIDNIDEYSVKTINQIILSTKKG